MVKTKSALVHFIHFENHAFQFKPKVEFSEIHCVFSGSGCGSVGRAVSSNTRDPQFELVISKFYLLLIVLKYVI